MAPSIQVGDTAPTEVQKPVQLKSETSIDYEHENVPSLTNPTDCD
jgi:sulfonate dioxygenase